MDVREKLVELLGAVSCNGNGESLGSCPDRKYGLCGEAANLSYCVIQNTVNHLIANGVTVQEWISVNDRLPEDGEVVLVFTVDKMVETSGCVALRVDRYQSITHWMPLPQPPKGE